MFTLVEAHTPEWLDRARAIFREYAASIEDVAGCSLQYQNFESELAALPGKYAPPRGGMFLAIHNPQTGITVGQPKALVVGCIAFRPLPELGENVCELKRMYVIESARRSGVGKALAQRVIAAATAAGYDLMKLDTSGTMHAAQRLYASLGFVPCPAYNADPEPGTLWFERPLRS